MVGAVALAATADVFALGIQLAGAHLAATHFGVGIGVEAVPEGRGEPDGQGTRMRGIAARQVR